MFNFYFNVDNKLLMSKNPDGCLFVEPWPKLQFHNELVIDFRRATGTGSVCSPASRVSAFCFQIGRNTQNMMFVNWLITAYSKNTNLLNFISF